MYEIYQKLLDSRNLKNADISRATGISNMTLSDWKRGKSTPKQDKLQKIADYFGVSIEYLMTGKEPTIDSSTQGYYIDEETAKTAQEIYNNDKILFDAICSHNPKSGMKAKTTLQYAVLAADPMSGFVKAVAQIYPDKKIASVKHKSVMKRFNELRFAAGANRDYMEAIEFTGLSLDDLIDVALEEMGTIADVLGL